MAIKREHFKEGFSKLPPWTCQSCSEGTYSAIKDKGFVVETGPSKAAHSHPDWDPDWIQERFTYLLECSSCKQVSVVAGTTSNFLHQFYEYDGEIGSDLVQTLHPEFISPAPLVFQVPKNTPITLKDEVLRAFSLLWSDHEACASRIRTCIELLLDDIKIPKERKTKAGKQKPLSLHQRIEEYASIDKESSEFLLAVKWIGNAGSHSKSQKLERDDLLDVFEILEYVLEQNYIGQKNRLSKIAAAINAARGKPNVSP